MDRTLVLSGTLGSLQVVNNFVVQHGYVDNAGWSSVPSIHRSVDQGLSDVSWLGKPYSEPRQITIRGVTFADLGSEEATRDQIAGLLRNVTLLTETVQGISKQTAVQIDGEIAIKLYPHRRIEWQAPYIAADPRLYSATDQGGTKVWDGTVAQQNYNLIPSKSNSLPATGWFGSTGGGVTVPITGGWRDGVPINAAQTTKAGGGLSVGVVIPNASGASLAGCRVRATSACRVRLTFTWLDSGGNILVMHTFPQMQVSAGAWTGQITQKISPPAGTVTAWMAADALGESLPAGFELAVGEPFYGASSDGMLHYSDDPGWTADASGASTQNALVWHLDNRLGTAPSTPTLRVVTGATSVSPGFAFGVTADERVVCPVALPTNTTVDFMIDDRVMLWNGGLPDWQPTGTWPVIGAGLKRDFVVWMPDGLSATVTLGFRPAWW